MTSKAIALRLARLEQSTGDRMIIVWCDDPEPMADAIAGMIDRGDAARDDTFIHWQSANSAGGVHEAALWQLG